jgi:hypothetical protein
MNTGVPYVIPQGRIKEKKESSFGTHKKGGFGSRPSKGEFGNRPSKGEFGNKTSKGEFGNRPSKGGFNKNSKPIKNRQTKIKRRDLVLKKYKAWIHKTYNLDGHKKLVDIHHWRPRSEVGTNDFFIVLLDPEYHINVVHGQLSPKGYINQEGERKLLETSWSLMDKWINRDEECSSIDAAFFREMLTRIKEDNFKNTLEITREFALEIYYNKGG